MKSFRERLTVVCGALALVVGLTSAGLAQQRSDKQTRDLVRTLSTQVDDLGYTIDNELRSDPSNRDLRDASDGLQTLQQRAATFNENLNAKREDRDDLNAIVDAARDVDTALSHGQQNQRIRQDWEAVKTTVGRLSGGYGITPDWGGGRNTARYPSSDSNYPQDRNNYPPTSSRRAGGPPVLTRSTQTSTRTSSVSTSDLTGTYKLDTSRSENTDQIISETNVGGTQRQDLQTKLEAPDQLAIFIRGNEVTLASSKASPVTFMADGSEKSETDANGRTIRLRSTLKGQDLTIASLGGDSDYTIVFSPTDNGRTLKVTRRITTSYLNQTVFADSVYIKTDPVAGLGIDTSGQDAASGNGGWSSNDNSTGGNNNTGGSNNGGSPTYPSPRAGDYVVPNGTIIIAQLENNIDTKLSQNNDHFRMTVQSPLDYRGAVIEGHVTGVGRSGRVSGSSNLRSTLIRSLCATARHMTLPVSFSPSKTRTEIGRGRRRGHGERWQPNQTKPLNGAASVRALERLSGR